MNRTRLNRIDDDMEGMAEPAAVARWQIKKELSLGDLLAIVIALLSVVQVYHALDVRLTIVEQEQRVARERDNEMKETVRSLRGDIAALAGKIDRLLERQAQTAMESGKR